MKLSYDKDIYNKSNIYNNNININSSRSFFGNSSKLENLQNLYFHINPYSNSTSIKSNQQIKDLHQFQSQTEPDSLEKKYAQPNQNNYKRFHFKVEEIKKGKKLKNQSPYTPMARDNPNLAFYSVGDLATLHPLTYQNIQSTKKFINSNTMKNNMRIQMIEEKMRKYEEKSDGLQILNNLFFDSLKDNLNQSLKRKAFIKRHLKELEYLKNIDLEEYNNQVDYINKLVEENNIDFDNYDDNGEPLNGVQNLEGKMEAMKTEIGTMLTKNTMKNDANLNVLRKDVDDVRKELEDKLMQFNLVNNQNFEILQQYLLREEEDRRRERKKKEEEERLKREKMLNAFTEDKNEKFVIKAKKKKKEAKKPKKRKKQEESDEGEVSTESNKDLDVIDKMLLDSMTVTVTETENNTKKSSSTSKGCKLEENKEIDLRSESSKTKKNSKNKTKKPKWKLLQKKDTDTIEEENRENEVEGDENVILGSYKSNFMSDKPEIQSKRSKKSKRFKISKETEEEEEEEKENEEEKEEEKENEDNNKHTIEGSYNRSNFYTNNPEIENKSKRSKNSKKFVLTDNTKIKSSKSKDLKDNEENLFSNGEHKTKSKPKTRTVTKSKKDENEDNYKPATDKEGEEEENGPPEDENKDNKKPQTESSSSSVYTETFKLTNKTGEKPKSLVNLKDIKEDEEVYLANDISNLNSNNGDKKSRKSKKSKKSKKKSLKSKSIKEENEEEDEK